MYTAPGVCAAGRAGRHRSMSANQKLTDYLREAYRAERDAAEHLADVIGRTARADHRVHLESHLRREREHAERLEERLRELGYSESPGSTVGAVAQAGVRPGGPRPP